MCLLTCETLHCFSRILATYLVRFAVQPIYVRAGTAMSWTRPLLTLTTVAVAATGLFAYSSQALSALDAWLLP